MTFRRAGAPDLQRNGVAAKRARVNWKKTAHLGRLGARPERRCANWEKNTSLNVLPDDAAQGRYLHRVSGGALFHAANSALSSSSMRRATAISFVSELFSRIT